MYVIKGVKRNEGKNKKIMLIKWVNILNALKISNREKGLIQIKDTVKI